MRLINTQTYKVTEFLDSIPDYAILSHTWGSDELSLQQWQLMKPSALPKCPKSGCQKVLEACALARQDKFNYIWVDTVCIDKTSSTELSEAINSMFSWYRLSKICYAYLADVEPISNHGLSESSFRASRWFTRGWTLQELLAPRRLVFFARDWSHLGDLFHLSVMVSDVSGIPKGYLCHSVPLSSASVGQKLSWVSNRVTTRLEDIAYCMLGLLDVNMTPLYGEGKKSFVRLQEELIKASDDHTLFTWSSMPEIAANYFSPYLRAHLKTLSLNAANEAIRAHTPLSKPNYPIVRVTHLVLDDRWNHDFRAPGSMLSVDPVTFYDCGSFSQSQSLCSFYPYATNNLGLSIRLPLFDTFGSNRMVVVVLRCRRRYRELDLVGLVLERIGHEIDVFARPNYPQNPILLSGMANPAWHKKYKKIQIVRPLDWPQRAKDTDFWRRLMVIFPLGMGGNIIRATKSLTRSWGGGSALSYRPTASGVFSVKSFNFHGPEGTNIIDVGVKVVGRGELQCFCQINPEPGSSLWEKLARDRHGVELCTYDNAQEPSTTDWDKLKSYVATDEEISSDSLTVVFSDDILVSNQNDMECARVMQIFFHENDIDSN